MCVRERECVCVCLCVCALMYVRANHVCVCVLKCMTCGLRVCTSLRVKGVSRREKERKCVCEFVCVGERKCLFARVRVRVRVCVHVHARTTYLHFSTYCGPL